MIETYTPVLISKKDIIDFLGEFPIIASSLRLTRKCQGKCNFCYSLSGKPLKNELGFREWDTILNYLISLGVMRFFITGGEPTLVPFLNKIISHITQASGYVALSSNGQKITQSMLEDFIKNKLTLLQISIDAPFRLHDRIRGIPGLFETCLDIIQVINKYYSRDLLSCVATVITAQNFNTLKELYNCLENVGCKRWVLIPHVPTGRGNINLSLTIEKLIKTITDLILLNYKRSIEIVPLIPPALIPRHGISSKWEFGYVSPFPNQLAFDSNGNVAFSDIFLNYPNFVFGNCKATKITELVNYALENRQEAKEFQPYEFIGVCSVCIFNEYCMGGDRPLSMVVTKGLNNSDLLCQNTFNAGLFPKEYLKYR